MAAWSLYENACTSSESKVRKQPDADRGSVFSVSPNVSLAKGLLELPHNALAGYAMVC